MLTAIQTAFDTAWSAAWTLYASTNHSYAGCWVIDNSSNTGGQVTNAAFSAVPGVGSTGSAADQMAALISLHTSVRYRGGHGRLYIPGASVSMLNTDGQSLTAGAIAHLEAMYTNTVTALNGLAAPAGGPLTPIVWNKKLLSAPNTIQPVVNHTIQVTTATQRRRIRKVSRHKRRVA